MRAMARPVLLGKLRAEGAEVQELIETVRPGAQREQGQVFLEVLHLLRRVKISFYILFTSFLLLFTFFFTLSRRQ